MMAQQMMALEAMVQTYKKEGKKMLVTRGKFRRKDNGGPVARKFMLKNLYFFNRFFDVMENNLTLPAHH